MFHVIISGKLYLLKDGITEADTYIPWLQYKYNRKFQSQEKKGSKTATKIKGQILSIIHLW